MARLYRISSFALLLAVSSSAMMVVPFSFWKVFTYIPPSPPAWQTGSLGNLNQTGGEVDWTGGNIYDYGSISLDSVTIVIQGVDGQPPVVGALDNLSMTNCTVIGTGNQDMNYDAGGNPVTTDYSTTPTGGPTFDYSVIPGQGGYGGGDAAIGGDGGAGLWGSGGGGGIWNGGSPTQIAGSDGSETGGGDGGGSPGSGAGIFGNSGGSNGGGGSLGLSGQNLMVAVWGDVLAFSGNSFFMGGSQGGDGGDGISQSGSPLAAGGGGGAGAGGFGGSAQFFVHGAGASLINDPTQFNMSGGPGGLGGPGGTGGIAGPGNPGGDGSAGQDGYFSVSYYY